jgi:hypothetical protein
VLDLWGVIMGGRRVRDEAEGESGVERGEPWMSVHSVRQRGAMGRLLSRKEEN